MLMPALLDFIGNIANGNQRRLALMRHHTACPLGAGDHALIRQILQGAPGGHTAYGKLLCQAFSEGTGNSPHSPDSIFCSKNA